MDTETSLMTAEIAGVASLVTAALAADSGLIAASSAAVSNYRSSNVGGRY